MKGQKKYKPRFWAWGAHIKIVYTDFLTVSGSLINSSGKEKVLHEGGNGYVPKGFL